jgi:hypothetical protein
VLVAALASGVYANSLANEFAYDDLHIVTGNPLIQSLHDLPGALSAPYWPNKYGQQLGLWRPLATAVYGLEWSLWGDHPTAYHLVNLLCHAAVSVLVLLLLSCFMPLAGALAGALVFSVHPVHVEAVANVVGLAEMLAGGFFLAACLVHLGADDRVGPRRIFVLSLLYGAAFLAKESSVVLPAVLVLIDAARRDLGWRVLPAYLRARGVLFLALVGTAAIILTLRYRVLGSLADPFAPLGAEILEEIPRIWTVAGIWPEYVRLLFFPRDLVADYAPAVIPVFFGWNPQNISGVIVALLFLTVALLAWRAPEVDGRSLTPRLAGLGIVWFVVTIASVSNVFFLSGVLLAERSLYVPSVGLAIAVGWLIGSFRCRRPRVAWGLLAVALILMGTRTWTRNSTWRNNETVFQTLIREHPESGRARWVLGDIHFGRNRVPQALYEYRAAIGILGTHYTLVTEIGKRLIGAERYSQATFLLRRSWEQRPQFSVAPSLLAIAYSRQNRYLEAEHAARAALKIEPSLSVAHHLLAGSLKGQGRYREAVDARLGAIRSGEAGHWQQWLWLADLQALAGDSAGAMASLDSARSRVGSPSDLASVDSLLEAWSRPEEDR